MRGDLLFRRIHLALRHGGLGLASVAEMAEAAYIGSIGLAGTVTKRLVEMSPGVAPLDPAVAFPHAHTIIAGGLGAAAGINTIADLFGNGQVLKLQQTLLLAANKAAFVIVRDTAPDSYTKAMVVSQNCAEASAFLTAVPGRGFNLRMSNLHFSVSLRQFIGAPCTALFAGRNVPPGHCLRCLICNPLAPPGLLDAPRYDLLITNEYGYHAWGCKALGGERAHRHFVVNAALFKWIQRHLERQGGNCTASREPDIAAAGGMRVPAAPGAAANVPVRSRGDILVEYNNGRKVVLDTTVTAAAGSTEQARAQAAAVPGWAAAQALAKKTAKYGALWNFPAAAGIKLVVTAFETSGRWHPDAMEFVRAFAKARFPDDVIAFARALRSARQCVSVAMRICVADAILRMAQLARAKLVPFALPAAPALAALGAVAAGGGGGG